jgi:hypothetical protein
VEHLAAIKRGRQGGVVGHFSITDRIETAHLLGLGEYQVMFTFVGLKSAVRTFPLRVIKSRKTQTFTILN